jgi:histidinol-phosphate phosphatase family protein
MSVVKHRAVFLDLNGTLVTPVLVERLADLRAIEGAAEGVALLCEAGFVCPVVTVQSRIEKGLFSEPEFRAWFQAFAARFAASGAMIAGPYVCPHRFATPCACAKPQTLLYERAAEDLGLDLSKSFVIGDTAADVEAARRFGGRGYLVGTGSTFDDAVDSILRHHHFFPQRGSDRSRDGAPT